MTVSALPWNKPLWETLIDEAVSAFDAPLHVALAFEDPPVDPPLPPNVARLELVVALPAWRLAGLRPWRDDVEVWSACASRQVVVWEALRWAQWWRRSDPRVVRMMGRTARIDDAEAWLVAVRQKAEKCPELRPLGAIGLDPPRPTST